MTSYETVLTAQLSRVFGQPPLRIQRMGASHDVRLFRASLADGRRVVVKWGPRLMASEGRMLRDLAGKTPLVVPQVYYSDDVLLITDWIDSDDEPLSDTGQEELAEAMHVLHANTADRFGYGYDVLIGRMPQINEWQPDWRTLFREKRLLGAAFLAHRAGRLPNDHYERLQRFCGRVDGLIDEPARPALLHGDFWSGNVLKRRGRPVALIDPALYYGHAEMDLAFSTLFGGMGPQEGRLFVEHYAALARLEPGWRERIAIWNLWPMLVHVYLYGEAYLGEIDRVLDRYV